MTVKELIEKLLSMPPDMPVMFDTDAARFDVHLIPVDYLQVIDATEREVCVLGSDAYRFVEMRLR